MKYREKAGTEEEKLYWARAREKKKAFKIIDRLSEAVKSERTALMNAFVAYEGAVERFLVELHLEAAGLASKPKKES